jgi:CubicO group peptidase (beta-lactamase class C family)
MPDELRRASFLGGLGGAAMLAACAGSHSATLPLLGNSARIGSSLLHDAIGSIVEANFKNLVSTTGGKGKGRGFVVGVSHAGSHFYFPFGDLTYHVSGEPVTKFSDALFFIGSNTKVFTGIMLALALQGGKVTLDTPAADLLPIGLRIKEPHGRILLWHLATHSAKPRLWPRASFRRLPVQQYDRLPSELRAAIRTGQILVVQQSGVSTARSGDFERPFWWRSRKARQQRFLADRLPYILAASRRADL